MLKIVHDVGTVLTFFTGFALLVIMNPVLQIYISKGQQTAMMARLAIVSIWFVIWSSVSTMVIINLEPGAIIFGEPAYRFAMTINRWAILSFFVWAFGFHYFRNKGK